LRLGDIDNNGVPNYVVSIHNSNVGIGTTAPLNLLHVSQAAANTIFRLGNNASYDQFIYFNGNNDWSLGMDYSNSNAFVLSNSSSIGTNDRVVVTTAGNVGIGTTAPTAMLNVANSGRALAVFRIQGTNRSSFYDNDFAVNNDGGGADGFIYGSNSAGGAFPFNGYGQKTIPKSETILIKNTTVWTNENEGVLKETDVLIENGKIAQVRNLLGGKGLGSTEFHVLRGKKDISFTDFIYYLSRWKEVREHKKGMILSILLQV
jgi:hypothetical protein